MHASLMVAIGAGALAGAVPAVLTSRRLQADALNARWGRRATSAVTIWVQAVTGALVGILLAVHFTHAPALAAYLLLAACAVPLSAVDLAMRKIPDAILGPAAVLTLLSLLIAVPVGGGLTPLVRGMLAALAVGVGFLVLAIVAGGGFGLGDVKLLAYLALLTGYQSWSAVLQGLFAGFAIAAVTALALRGGRGGKQIPLAPWLIFGAVIVLMAS